MGLLSLDIYTVKPGKPEISKDMHFFTQSTNGLPSILGVYIKKMVERDGMC